MVLKEVRIGKNKSRSSPTTPLAVSEVGTEETPRPDSLPYIGRTGLLSPWHFTSSPKQCINNICMIYRGTIWLTFLLKHRNGKSSSPFFLIIFYIWFCFKVGRGWVGKFLLSRSSTCGEVGRWMTRGRFDLSASLISGSSSPTSQPITSWHFGC